MAGTKAGGARAAQSNKERHGDDFYIRIGKMGGKNGHTGGFYADRELARRAGRKGGTISRRRPSQKPETQDKSDWAFRYNLDNDSAIIEFQESRPWWRKLW